MNAALAGLVPLIVLAAAFIPAGEGPSATAARVAAPLLAGLGLLPVAFALRARRGWALGATIAAATGVGVVLGAVLARSPADVATLVAWVLITFLTLLGLVTPLLAIGCRGAAAVTWLLVAALSCGSLLLARGGLVAIPQPLLDFNPIVRIFWHGLSFDWLHAANVYPRIGTIYYRYPDRSDGILVALVIGAIGALAGAGMAFFRREPASQP
jgi:hypothetical protein